jgi:hypothetical protein
MRALIVLCATLLLGATPPKTAASPSSPEKVRGTAFPDVPGFRVTLGPSYGPENLFEYIDGGADAFLQFEFEELQTATYLGADKVEVTVDLYRHKNADRAYGMYALERPPGTLPIPVGVEGYAGADHLAFATGAYYVKLVQAGPKGDFVLGRFAEKLARALPGRKTAPAVLAAFPDGGKVPRAEKLAASNFLGHGFLHDGVAVPYKVDGASFRLFAVHGKDGADVRDMVGRYRAVAKAPASEVKPSGGETLKDPYNGEVLLHWSGSWLWGAVDGNAPSRQRLLDDLGRRLPRND